MTVQLQFFLAQWQRLARGYPDLPFHKIKPGHHFGHRMLNLQTRVHLHEVEAAILIGNELNRARSLIIDRGRRLYRRFAHRRAAFGRHARRRRFFKNLLMTALHRTIAFEQVDMIAMAVAKHLHLDMARAGDVFFDQNGGVAKTGLRLALTRGQHGLEIGRLLDQPHPLAAAARTRLDEHRPVDLLGFGKQGGQVLRGTVITGRQRHTGRPHQAFSRRLAAHGTNGLHRRPDEDEAIVEATLRKVGVFGKKTVAGVNGLRAGGSGGSDDALAHQIAFARGRGTDGNSFIGHPHMTCTGIGGRIHGHRRDAHTARGTDDPTSDFAAIGNKYLADFHGATSETRQSA